MKMKWTLKTGAIGAFAMIGAASGAAANPAEPTCSDTLGIDVHGQHVVADYVTGLHGDLDWPPSDQNIGEIVRENGGAVTPGGPGPGFHFPNNFAPGASFCTGSQSPGTHL
jgi:hypothetical protein